jgi:hypothetical protein
MTMEWKVMTMEAHDHEGETPAARGALQQGGL